METPKRICLIDTGDGVVWCDSVPSDDIEDSDVVWYTRTPPATEKLIAALKTIRNFTIQHAEVSSSVAKVQYMISANDTFEIIDEALAVYQKEQEL